MVGTGKRPSRIAWAPRNSIIAVVCVTWVTFGKQFLPREIAVTFTCDAKFMLRGPPLPNRVKGVYSNASIDGRWLL